MDLLKSALCSRASKTTTKRVMRLGWVEVEVEVEVGRGWVEVGLG